MKKRKLAVVLASVILLGTGVTAFTNNVEARNPTCGNCNEGMYTSSKVFAVSTCKRCHKDGCCEEWWGWKCGNCGEFIKTSLKELHCTRYY